MRYTTVYYHPALGNFISHKRDVSDLGGRYLAAAKQIEDDETAGRTRSVIWSEAMAEDKDIDYTEQNIVDITINVSGNALVVLNGDTINEDDADPKNKVTLTLEHEGDVLVTVNGEDFMVEKEHRT